MSVTRFWQNLAADHATRLEIHGFEQVKRQQALRYFSWTWRWRGIWRSEQMRWLLRHSSLRMLLKAARGIDTRSGWDGVQWSNADRWLYAFATRTLWQHAAHLPTAELPEPELGNPYPVHLDGRLISQDLANTAMEVAYVAGYVPPPTSVLEVGAGYGRTAYAWLSLHPHLRYTIVDIEPALSISRWYLTTLFGPDRLTFLAPGEVDRVERVDLAVSISTLAEMDPTTVDLYLDLFDHVAEYVYLKQWAEWKNPTDDLVMRFDLYRRPGWTMVAGEQCAVQTQFRHGIWRTTQT